MTHNCRNKNFIINSVIFCVSVLALFPFLWIGITAMKSPDEALKNPLSVLPLPFMLFENLREVWSRAAWISHYRNSLALLAGVWAAQMIIAIPAGYALALMRFRGQRFFLLLILARLMVSAETAMLANYLTVLKLGAYDTLAGIALPYLVSAQAILLFRQAFKQTPPALRDSARIDGCGDFQFMIRIGVPLIKPSIASFSIISGVFQWNAFFWPMLVTRSPSKRILPLALAAFGMQAETGAEWALTMTAVLMVSAPLLLAFVIFQKKWLSGFMRAWTS